MSIVGVNSIFPTVVGNCQRNDLIEPVKNIIKNMKDDEWVEEGSASVNILDKDKKLKKDITEEVQNYLKEALSTETEIKMTTSWITKAVKGQPLNIHDHNNSWMSGCFYIQDNCEIQFSTQTPQIKVEPKVNTILNSSTIVYQPTAGTMLIFPSKTIVLINSTLNCECIFFIDWTFFKYLKASLLWLCFADITPKK